MRSKETLQRIHQKTYKKTGLSKRVGFFGAELFPALLLLVIPFSVHADLVSKVISIFSPEQDTVAMMDAMDTSAGSTPLLNAIKNPDPLKAVGGGDIYYEDGVLISTGPIGKDVISASNKTNGNGEISVYVVRDGDSLSQIAEMYGVTTNTILWANDLKSANDIHPGDSLVILPIVGIRHTVEKGETLASIVKKYGADLNDVMQYNGLATADSITVGDVIIIPGGEMDTETSDTATSKTASSQTTSKHTVTYASVSKNGSWLINPAPGSVQTQGIHGYNAVDLASYGGKHIPVIAAAAGTVIVSKSSGWNGGYGQYIVIKHSNGVQTLYGHLSKNLVGVGDVVRQGQQIGIMGETGKATGVHVHFEVRGDVNPF